MSSKKKGKSTSEFNDKYFHPSPLTKETSAGWGGHSWFLGPVRQLCVAALFFALCALFAVESE